jgi:hypothetical protein
MVTSGALVTWMDRGDARPQPEATVDIFPALDAADEEDIDGSGPYDPPTAAEEAEALSDDDFLPVVDDDGVVRHAEEAVVQDEPSDDPEFAVQGA